MDSDLHEDEVSSREALARYVLDLRADLRAHQNAWENVTLESYLEARVAWIRDMPGWFENRGVPEPAAPRWGLIAHMLRAGSTYE